MLRSILICISLQTTSGKYQGPPIVHAAQVVVNDVVYLVQGSRIDPVTRKRTVLDKLLSLDTYKDFKVTESPWEEEDLDGNVPALDSTACSQLKPNSTIFFCFGGKYQDSSVQFNDGSPMNYDTANRKWTIAEFSTNDQPPNRFGHTLTTLPDGSGILLFGGAPPGSTEPFNDFWHLSSLRKWEQLKTSAIQPRYYHTMSVVSKGDSYKLVVIGGKRSGNSLAPTDYVLVYDKELENWKIQQVRFPITPRHSHSAIVWGKHILVFGGTDASNSEYYSDIVSLNTESWEWSTVSTSEEIAGRYGHNSALFGNYMLVFFGSSRSLGSQTYIFDIVSRKFVSSFSRIEAYPKPASDNTVLIASVVFGGIVALFFIIFLGFYCYKKYLSRLNNRVAAVQPLEIPIQQFKNESFFDLPIESGLEEFSSQEWPITPDNQLISELNINNTRVRESESRIC